MTDSMGINPGEQFGGDATSDSSSVNVTTVPDERDVKIAELEATVELLTGQIARRDRADAAFAPGPRETLSADEVAVMLSAVKQGVAHSAGSVCSKVDGGVYCQFNRPGVDGSYHCWIEVPEEFALETFVPASE